VIEDSPEGLHDLLHLGPSLLDGSLPEPGAVICFADAEDREASDPPQGRFEPDLRSRTAGGDGGPSPSGVSSPVRGRSRGGGPLTPPSPTGIQGPGQMGPEERQDQGRERVTDPEEVFRGADGAC
jgi:hypothetical protein